MADIFVSYSSDDRARVEPLVTQLEGAGYTVWWDSHLRGGSMFSQEIESELKGASAVLVIWSIASVKSRWVADEAELALRTNKLVPISLDDMEAPIGFRQVQTIDFSQWNGQADHAALKTLINAVGHHTGALASPRDQRDSKAPEASIAVLPFVNMSSDPEQEYFSDGISEELLNLLAKIKQMKVTARTSSFEFKGKNQDISKIGEMLNVAHVLEGSVRKAGNRVRITAQLIEVATGYHMWSDNYDRTLDDIFAVQDEISAAIVGALKSHILGEVEAPHANRNVNIEAYELCLLGQQLLNRRNPVDLEKGKVQFEKALKLDSEYPRALVGLADGILLLSNSPGCYGSMPVDQARAAAWPLLQKAQNLEPKAEEVLCILGFYYDMGGDYETAMSHVQQAIAINPNYRRAYHVKMQVVAHSGDPAASFTSLLRKGLEMDPMSLVGLYNLADSLASLGRYEEAETVIEKMELVGGTTRFFLFAQAMVACYQGRYKDALNFVYRPEVAWDSGNATYLGLHINIVFGNGAVVENASPVVALLTYAQLGMTEDANRLGNVLLKQDEMRQFVTGARAIANWLSLEGRNVEALEFLKPFDHLDPNKWGSMFNHENDFFIARLSLYARGKTGDNEGARLYLEKLRKHYEITLQNSDGVNFNVHLVGAIVAALDGNIALALDRLELQVERSLFKVQAFLKDPNLEVLHDEPRYIALCERVDAHFAAEKTAAEESGFLPIPKEIIALMPNRLA